MSDLLVRATLTADASGLIGAAKQGALASQELATAVQGVGEAGNQAASTGRPLVDHLDQVNNSGKQALETLNSLQSAGSLKNLNLAGAIDDLAGLDNNFKSAAESYAAFTQTMRGQAALDNETRLWKDQAAAAGSLGLGLRALATDAPAAASGAKGLAAAGAEVAGSAELSSFQIQELTYSARHLAEQLAAGIPITRIAANEALHLSAAFQSPIQFLKALGSLITPEIAALAALAAVVGVVAAGIIHADDVERQWQLTLVGAGRYVGATAGQLEAMAQRAASANAISTAAARDIAQQFIKTGTIQGQQLAGLTQTTVAYARATGAAYSDAGGELAKAMADPTRAGEELLKNMGLLDAATKAQIETFMTRGDVMAAQQTIQTALNKAIQDAADKTSWWASTMRSARSHWSEFMDALAWEFDQSNDQRIQQLQGRLANYDVFNDLTGQRQRDQAELAQRLARRAAEQQKSRQAAEEPQRNQLSLDVSAAVSSYDPFGAQLKALSDQRALIEKASAQNVPIIANGQRISAEKALAENTQKTNEVLKAQHDYYLRLNDEMRRHEEQVKSLIGGSAALIASERLKTGQDEQMLQVAGLGAAAQKDLNDQFAIQAKTLPYLTAMAWAHGAQLTKLKQTVADVTAEMLKQQAAEEEAAAQDDLQTKIEGYSGAYSQAVLAADRWGDSQVSAANKALAAGLITQSAYDEQMQKVRFAYGQMMVDAQQYTQDFNDAISGSIDSLGKKLANWGDEARSIMQSFDRTGEDAFVQWAMSGKSMTSQLISFMEEEFLRLAYKRYLAQSFNSVAGGILSEFGSLIGIPSGGIEPVTVTPNVMTGGYHSGGMAGGAPTFLRMADARMWAGARRFHLGGLTSDEVPIIARKGEGIFTPEQMTNANATLIAALSRPIIVAPPAANSNQPPAIAVHIHDNAGVKATVDQTPQRNAQGGWDINVMLDRIDAGLADRSIHGKSQYTRTLENTHGIKRTPMS